MLRRLLDSPWTYYVLAGVLLVVAVLSQFEFRPPARPPGSVDQLATLRERDDLNVLFILIDTLRADRLHAYGYPRETSPWMDELARTGIRFERVVGQSTWTKSSMASLWTGTHPARNGILRWGHALPDTVRMPAEVLREAGFRTTGIFRNGWVSANFGFSQGFETYVKPVPNVAPAPTRSPRAYEKLQGSDEDITFPALEFLRTYGRERFLLYVHYMDVHQYTYGDHSALFGTSYSDAYDNAIHWTDQNVGVLVRKLDELGVRDRTLLVIVSDHGEEFQEHGREGHAKSLYREVTEVPWILSLPFRLEPGIVVPGTVQNVDVWPTLLDLLGLPALEETDGRSLLPEIQAAARGTPPEGNGLPPAFAQLDRRWGRPELDPDPLVAVTEGSYRLILATAGEEPTLELYDHASDPLEAENLATEQPEVTERLRARVDTYLAQPATAWGQPLEVEISDLERGQLRALGYVFR